VDVHLVRHAIADRRDPARWPDDAKRPLTAEGIARFRSAARGLRRLVPRVETVLSSPYARSWQTAVILHEDAGWPAPDRCPALEAVRPSSDAVEVLEGLDSASSVALVGHEPYLSRLASLLLSGNESLIQLELKKGGVALIAFADHSRPGAGLLRWSASPKILRALDPGVGPS
jgi:phosphohistidine phosphatase